MMSRRQLKIWSWLHKWTSLICTLFMLLLCLTGLPLIFHHEIGHLLGTEAEAVDLPINTPRVSLDRVMAIAKSRFPDKEGMFVSQAEDDDRIWFVTLASTPTSHTDLKQAAIDARTGELLVEPPLNSGFMYIMRSLHIDLFAGLPGTLFLGFMGFLLLIALVSGVVLYAPFMRKLEFGEVRRSRSKRIKWLDLHNLLGISTLVWFFVVGATGMINTWADPLIKLWQFNEMGDMIAPYKNKPPLEKLGSLQAAVDAAIEKEPRMKIAFIAFPGTTFSSPHHYGVFMRGTEAFSSRLLKPVLVDATTSKVTDSRNLPWYLTALLLSQPLHFGDYGGKIMQIIWAILDIIAIIVLGSGIYLWAVKHKQESRTKSAEASGSLRTIMQRKEA